MAAERNFFHRWRGMTTIGYELGVIWEMSVNMLKDPLRVTDDFFELLSEMIADIDKLVVRHSIDITLTWQVDRDLLDHPTWPRL